MAIRFKGSISVKFIKPDGEWFCYKIRTKVKDAKKDIDELLKYISSETILISVFDEKVNKTTRLTCDGFREYFSMI